MNTNQNKTCDRSSEVLEYEQKEMTSEASNRFEEHLEQCRVCRQELSELKEIKVKLMVFPRLEVKRDLAKEVLTNVHVTSQTSRGAFSRSFLAIAALLLMGCGLWYAWRINGEDLTEISSEKSMAIDTAHKKANGIQSSEDQALKEGLEWLLSIQEPSGAWMAEKWGAKNKFQTGLTGLGLIACLNGQKAAFSRDWQDGIDRAISYLINQQAESGVIGPAVPEQLYNHGITTVALLQAYKSNASQELKKSLSRAIDFILLSQKADGGWAYHSSNRVEKVSNTSISVWPLQALLSARKQNWTNVDSAVRRGMEWLSQRIDEDGNFGYRVRNDFPFGNETLTAMGGIFWHLRGRQGLEYLDVKIKLRSRLEKLVMERQQDVNYYQFYFLTKSLKMFRKKHSDTLIKDLQNVLAAKQVRSGPLAGSWEPDDRWGKTGGRIYSTALAATSLSIGYQ